MPSPTLETLSTESLNQLAHLLQTLPQERGLEYSERVAYVLKQLPIDMKHRSRLSNLLSTNTPSPIIEARLCLLHKPLSTSLVHEIFTLLSLEVGHNCNSLTQHNSWLSAKQHTATQRLRELHSLWLPAETYTKTFLEPPNPQWPYQKSGCEGCILTRVGSDLQIVAELRALLLSRRRTIKPMVGHPKLLRFVDGWLVGLLGSGERGREVMQGSEMEGQELKIIRKRIWRERREKRKTAKGKTIETEIVEGEDEADMEVQEDGVAKDAYHSDFESDIIDHYAALTSTLRRPSIRPLASQTPSLTTGTSAHSRDSHLDVPQTPKSDGVGLPQASSMYSIHQSKGASGYQPPRREKAWRVQTSAGGQAEAYRNLLTPPPEESTPRSLSIQKEKRRAQTSRSPYLPTSPSERSSTQSRPYWKEDNGQWEAKHQYPFPPSPPEPQSALPISKSKARSIKQAEQQKRQTTWSQFCK